MVTKIEVGVSGIDVGIAVDDDGVSEIDVGGGFICIVVMSGVFVAWWNEELIAL